MKLQSAECKVQNRKSRGPSEVLHFEFRPLAYATREMKSKAQNSQSSARLGANCRTAKVVSLLQFCTLHAAFCLLLVLPASAQVGDCPGSQGEAYLDAGNVRARILNNGALFWRGEPHVYEVPKGSGGNAMFNASIWIVGLINGELRGAATRYGEWEFWTGPLDESGNPPEDCAIYDRIWEIRREDIEEYLSTEHVSDNLQGWPWQLGAPVIDGDGNPENYNLEGGDLPELLGDQRLWWIMNDRGNEHKSTDSKPVGLEVHASAFAFNHPRIGNHTFYRYRLINKNTSPFTDAYFGFFTDIDLGNFSDDYIGSDSLLHLGYAYNADNEDIGGTGWYGTAPPAIGFTFLETAIRDTDGRDNDRDRVIDEPGEMIGTTSVIFYNSGGGVTEDPIYLVEYYMYMQSRWKDGKPLLLGWNGYEDYWPPNLKQTPTKFAYPGDPVTKSFWTELNDDNQGTPNSPADRRFVTSSGPFTIPSGDTLDISIAIVWSRGKDHLDSVTELKKDVTNIRSNVDFLYSPTIAAPQISFPPNRVLGFDQNFPNPFSESTTLRYSLPKSMQVRLAVYDVLGREVEVLVEEQQDAGVYSVEFDAGELPAGIYFARMEMDFLRFTKRMVLVK